MAESGTPGDVSQRSRAQSVMEKVHDVCPGFTPLPQCALPTELLSGGSIVTLKDSLVHAHDGADVDREVFRQLGRRLAQLHKSTHSNTIGDHEFKNLQDSYGSASVLDATCQSMFVQPYLPKDDDQGSRERVLAGATRLQANRTIQDAVEALRQGLMTRKECLLQGDLSTAAVAVTEGQVKLLRYDKSLVGPCAYDLGVLLAHLLLCHYQHMLTPEDNDSHRQVAHAMVAACHDTVTSYLEVMDIHSDNEEQRTTFVNTLMSDVAGYTGCELVRSVLGAERPAELNVRPQAQEEVLEAGIRLLMAHRRIDTVYQLTMIGLMLC